MNSNRNNMEIQRKKMSEKSEKKQVVPLAFSDF